MTLIDKNFLKLSKICPSCFSRYEHLHCFVQVHFKISVHAQHLLLRAVDKLTDEHVATIYEAYQTDIYLSLEDFRREVAKWRTHWVIVLADTNTSIALYKSISKSRLIYASIQRKIACHSSWST
jgi:hypothetical protein